MDPLERLLAIRAIEDVIGRYCMLFDDQDWDGLAELWTDDAAFMIDDEGFEGRDVLMHFLRTCLPAGYHSKHMISPPVIDLADDGRSAHGATDVIWLAANFETTIVARYNDQFVRSGDRWLIQRRTEHPMQHIAGPPPMSTAATGVSSPTMKPN